MECRGEREKETDLFQTFLISVKKKHHANGIDIFLADS